MLCELPVVKGRASRAAREKSRPARLQVLPLTLSICLSRCLKVSGAFGSASTPTIPVVVLYARVAAVADAAAPCVREAFAAQEQRPAAAPRMLISALSAVMPPKQPKGHT